MATYSEVSITGYNSNPPEDDGTEASSNEVSWSKHKTKIGDPLKTALESTQTNISTLAASLTGELNAPSGTLMLFQQTSAPTGWTKQTTHNNKALRLVSGTASSGGSTAFTSVFTSRTIALANLPSYNLSHSLAFSDSFTPTANGSTIISARSGSSASQAESGTGAGPFYPTSQQNTADQITASGTVTGTVSSGGSGTAMDFAVQYVDVIIASKDS